MASKTNTMISPMPLAQSNKDLLTTLAIDMRNGNPDAITMLYEEMNPKIYGFFLSRTGYNTEIAEDLSQDAFMRVMKNVKCFDEARGSFVVWFWQIARNMLIDHYRAKKEKNFSYYAEEDIETLCVAPPANLHDRLRYLKLENFLQSMNEDERELFEMRYVQEMRYKEISILLGKSPGVLRVASFRIREKIRARGLEDRWDA